MSQKQTRPSLAVIGLGDYYAKLKRALWKHLKPVALVDIDPSAVQRLSAQERAVFAKARKAAVIEKPIATNAEGLANLWSLVQSELPLYFSDFYVDVRAVPLLLAAGRLPLADWRRQLIRGILRQSLRLLTSGQHAESTGGSPKVMPSEAIPGSVRALLAV